MLSVSVSSILFSRATRRSPTCKTMAGPKNRSIKVCIALPQGECYTSLYPFTSPHFFHQSQPSPPPPFSPAPQPSAKTYILQSHISCAQYIMIYNTSLTSILYLREANLSVQGVKLLFCRRSLGHTATPSGRTCANFFGQTLEACGSIYKYIGALWLKIYWHIGDPEAIYQRPCGNIYQKNSLG